MQKVNRELRFIRPMECREVDEAHVPTGRDWCYEIKHDGYRALTIKQDNAVSIYTRNGNLLTQTPNLYPALHSIRARQFILDGEAVVLDAQGRSSFALMQTIRRHQQPATFYAFDVLHWEGEDLINVPLRERRRLLDAQLADPPEHVRLSPLLNGTARIVLEQLRALEFEGIVAKRLDSRYEPGERSGAWVKHKTQLTADFVIGGWIGDRAVEELIIGERRKDEWHFVEAVKNGFVPATRVQVYKAIKSLATAECPFANLPEKKGPHAMDREKMRSVHWVKPRVLVEIAFNERTANGHLRHARYLRLRTE